MLHRLHGVRAEENRLLGIDVVSLLCTNREAGLGPVPTQYTSWLAEELKEARPLAGNQIVDFMYGIAAFVRRDDMRKLISALASHLLAKDVVLTTNQVWNTLAADRTPLQPLATSAPGLGSPRPYLHRDSAHPGTSERIRCMRNAQVTGAFRLISSFESTSETHQLVGALCKQLSRLPAAHIDSRLLATSLYGVHSLSDSEALRSLMKTVSLKLSQVEDEFSNRDIALSLYGMQNCGDSPELHGLVRALLPKIAAARSLTDRDFANMLYGAQGLADSALARNLWAHVSDALSRSNEPFSPRAFSACVYGLKNQADGAEVRDLLRALCKRAPRADGSLFTEKLCAMMFYGVNGMHAWMQNAWAYARHGIAGATWGRECDSTWHLTAHDSRLPLGTSRPHSLRWMSPACGQNACARCAHPSAAVWHASLWQVWEGATSSARSSRLRRRTCGAATAWIRPPSPTYCTEPRASGIAERRGSYWPSSRRRSQLAATRSPCSSTRAPCTVFGAKRTSPKPGWSCAR